MSVGTFSDDELLTIRLAFQLMSIISIVSSLLIMTIYWFFKEIRSFLLGIVIWLCISNILYCSAAFFPYNNVLEDNKMWCAIQAFMMITFQYASFIISCLIGYSSFISVIRKDHLENHKVSHTVIFLLLTVVISVSLASIILFTDSYGPTGGWCWLDVYRCKDKCQGNKDLIHKLILFYYCVNWFFIILNAFFIFKVICILNRQSNRNITRSHMLSMYHRLKWFPIIEIVCIIPSTISRIYNVFNLEPNFWLTLLQTIFSSSMGLGFLIAFLGIPQVKDSLQVFFAKLCMRIRGEGEAGNTMMDNASDMNLLNEERSVRKKISNKQKKFINEVSV